MRIVELDGELGIFQIEFEISALKVFNSMMPLSQRLQPDGITWFEFRKHHNELLQGEVIVHWDAFISKAQQLLAEKYVYPSSWFTLDESHDFYDTDSLDKLFFNILLTDEVKEFQHNLQNVFKQYDSQCKPEPNLKVISH